MIKPNGGPAFPVEANAGYGPCEGMTLRDYFAGQAVAGLCDGNVNQDHVEAMVNLAYDIADRMISVR